MTQPSRLAFERVMIPRRLHAEPESGLDGFIAALTSVALSSMGFHALGEMLHAVHTAAEFREAMQPETRGQSETLARQAFDRDLGQATLSTPNPMVMVESWMPVRRPIQVLDPSLRVTDPSLAQIYQAEPRRSLGQVLGLQAPSAPAPSRRPSRPSPMAHLVL